MQGSTDRSEDLLKRPAANVLEQDELVSSLNNAKKSTDEIQEALHTVKVGKQALVAPVDLQAAHIRTVKSQKGSLKISLWTRTIMSEQREKRYNNSDVYSGLSHQYVQMANTVLKYVSRCCGCDRCCASERWCAHETAELCLFSGPEKPKW